MSPIPVQPVWVGSGPLTAGRSDTPIRFHGTPPEWGGTRSGSQYTGTSLEVQPASGTRVCAKSQKPRPPILSQQSDSGSSQAYVFAQKQRDNGTSWKTQLLERTWAIRIQTVSWDDMQTLVAQITQAMAACPSDATYSVSAWTMLRLLLFVSEDGLLCGTLDQALQEAK